MSVDALFEILLGVVTAEGSAQKGENYVYKNPDAEIVGVLRVLSTGVFIIAVRSDFRRRGVGTALLKAANQRKPIDFSKSTYSRDGQALVDAHPKWELTKTQCGALGVPVRRLWYHVSMFVRQIFARGQTALSAKKSPLTN
jgi:hypothetical protein